MKEVSVSRFSVSVSVAIAALVLILAPRPAAASSDLVISQIYGGGGNFEATYNRDFVELFNRGDSTASLANHSIQYASTAGSTWFRSDLTGNVPPGGYFLIHEGAVGAEGVPLPTGDVISSVALSSLAGKVALTSDQVTLSGTCPSGSQIVDLVGYGGGTNCSETNVTSGPDGNGTSVTRFSVCTDTDDNSADFFITPVNPRNSLSTATPCIPPNPPTVTSTSPASPSPELQLTIMGNSDPGTMVFVYPNLTCSGDGIAGVNSAEYGESGLTISVEENQTASFSLNAKSSATGLTSGCATGPTFTNDTIAPSVSITGNPGAQTADPTPQFTFTSNEPGGSFECSIDQGSASFAPCSGSGVHQPSADLEAGSYVFRVRPIDLAGNVGTEAQHEFQVTAVDVPDPPDPPDTRITRKPKAVLKVRLKTKQSKARVTVAFASTGETTGFECKLDKAGWKACTSPRKLSVKVGKHTLQVRATGPGGKDATPAKATFKVVRKARKRR